MRSISDIAKELGLDTIETRNSDQHDLKTHSAASIRSALEAAYNAGLAAGSQAASDPWECLYAKWGHGVVSFVRETFFDETDTAEQVESLLTDDYVGTFTSHDAAGRELMLRMTKDLWAALAAHKLADFFNYRAYLDACAAGRLIAAFECPGDDGFMLFIMR